MGVSFVHGNGTPYGVRGLSVCSKSTLIMGHVGGARVCPPTCKMGTFFQIPLALTMPISNNFQLNAASGETLRL